jgi:transposase-like protein
MAEGNVVTVLNMSELARQHGVTRSTIRRRLAAATLTLPAQIEPAEIELAEIVPPDQASATPGEAGQATAVATMTRAGSGKGHCSC